MENWCPDCGSMMFLMKVEDKEVLKCKRCGFIKELDPENIDRDSFKITTEFRHSEKDLIEVQKGDLNTMPTTRIECPKCGHSEAAYWQLQTRGADEGMTTFYRCLKCKNTWRAY
jgi:DNA-directed RNA polymerase subunit M